MKHIAYILLASISCAFAAENTQDATQKSFLGNLDWKRGATYLPVALGIAAHFFIKDNVPANIALGVGTGSSLFLSRILLNCKRLEIENTRFGNKTAEFNEAMARYPLLFEPCFQPYYTPVHKAHIIDSTIFAALGAAAFGGRYAYKHWKK